MADTARKITAESLHARLPVGEVARFDEQLVSRFHLLHERRVSWRRRPSSWLSTACVFPRRWMYARYAGERRSTDRIGPHHSESQRSTFNCFAGLGTLTVPETRESEGRFR